MKNTEIIKYIKDKYPKHKIKAVVMHEHNKFICCVMSRFSGGSGVGFCGSKTLIDVSFNTQNGAKTLKELINKEFA